MLSYAKSYYCDNEGQVDSSAMHKHITTGRLIMEEAVYGFDIEEKTFYNERGQITKIISSSNNLGGVTTCVLEYDSKNRLVIFRGWLESFELNIQ